MSTINCTGVVRKKKLNFFHWFFKNKNEHGNSGAWQQWSMAPLFTEQWSHAPLFQKITMRSSILLLLHSCGWAAKTSRPYQVKSDFLHLPNIKMCGCGWTSPAATKPNSVYKDKLSLSHVYTSFGSMNSTISCPWSASLVFDCFNLVENSLSNHLIWSFGPPNQMRFDSHCRYTFSLQGSATRILNLHLVCHDDLFKITHSVSHDWRRKSSWFFKPHGYFLLTSLSLQKDKKNQNAVF